MDAGFKEFLSESANRMPKNQVDKFLAMVEDNPEHAIAPLRERLPTLAYLYKVKSQQVSLQCGEDDVKELFDMLVERFKHKTIVFST